jgi:hypothetical protein
MSQRINKFATFVLVASGSSAFAQKPSAPTSASAPASQPEPNSLPGGDPTWMVIDVGIALVAGLIVGYLIGAWRSSAKNRASHA